MNPTTKPIEIRVADPSYLEPDRQTGTGPAGLPVAGPIRSNLSDRPVFTGFLPVKLRVWIGRSDPVSKIGPVPAMGPANRSLVLESDEHPIESNSRIPTSWVGVGVGEWLRICTHPHPHPPTHIGSDGIR